MIKYFIINCFCCALFSLNILGAQINVFADHTNGNITPKNSPPPSPARRTPTKKSPLKKSPQKNTYCSNAELNVTQCKKVAGFFDDGDENAASYLPEKISLTTTKAKYSSNSSQNIDYDDASLVSEIFVSLTTSPERVTNLKHILGHLKPLLEKGKLKGVYLNLPVNYRNEIKEDGSNQYQQSEIAELIQELNNKIIVNWLPHDLGPISKMLPTLKDLKAKHAKNSLIISIDDDQYYDPRAVLALVDSKLKFASCILSFAGGPLEHYGCHELGFPKSDAVTTMARQKIYVDEQEYDKYLANLKRSIDNHEQQIIKARPKNRGKENVENNENALSPKAQRIFDEKTKLQSNLWQLQEAEKITIDKVQLRKVGSKGVNKKELNDLKKLALGMDVDVVEGQSMIVYDLDDFDNDDIYLLEQLSDKSRFGSDCHLSDDLIISFVLSLNNKSCLYLKKLESQEKWRAEREKEHALITSGALTHGSGYSQAEKTDRKFEQGKNNDRIKYQKALTVLLNRFKDGNGRYLSKKDMVALLRNGMKTL